MGNIRRKDIDLLKGIAILAVVFYHVGFLPSGYLGVDVFFVLGGFLIVPKIVEQVLKNEFQYLRFLAERIIRFLPLLLIVSLISMVIGYFFWLPDDYENLSESVVASNLFSNNILSAITTGNYWDTVNEYKPLMHTWYLGILMEFYITVPLIVLIFGKLSGCLHWNGRKVILFILSLLTLISFLVFLLYPAGTAQKFYYLPFRFYELSAGGVVGCIVRERGCLFKGKKVLSCLFFMILCVIICIGIFSIEPGSIGKETWIIGNEEESAGDHRLLIPNMLAVPLTVLFTVLFLGSEEISLFNKSRFLPMVGRRSYSIFVWHQVLLALYRYSISIKITVGFLILYIVVLAIVTEISYRKIEQIRLSKKSFIVTTCGALILSGVSFGIYHHAGVVRDIPELDIRVSDVHRNMHAEYCDRVYAYQDDFSMENGKRNILVVGNSFARDFGNILLESTYADKINLSYRNWLTEDQDFLIQQADRIFVFSAKEKVSDFIWDNVSDKSVVYGIGTKNYGTNNGQIYSHRFSNDYFTQTAEYDKGYKTLNEDWERAWGDHYVELIAPVETEDGRIRVFTDDDRYISQDCRHLTKAGAEYYTRLLDLENLIF